MRGEATSAPNGAPTAGNSPALMPNHFPAESSSTQVSPLKVFSTVRRHWIAVTVTTVCVFVPATIVISTLKPYYDAQSVLMIGTRQAPLRDLQATESSTDINTIAINTQVSVLQSTTVATGVARKLDLVHEPEFQTLLDHVSMKTKIKTWVLNLFGAAPVVKPLTPEQRLEATTSMLTGHVKVINDGRSAIVTVTARTGDAVLSSRIANAYADVYLDFRRNLKIQATWRANGMLDEQIAPLRDRLRKAEQAAEEFREKNNMVSAQISHVPLAGESSDGTTVADQQLLEMNRQLITAQAELELKRANYGEVQAAIASGSVSGTAEAVASPMIQQLQTQATQIDSQIASLGRSAMDGNPQMQAQRAASAHIHARIAEAMGLIVQSVGKELEGAQARVNTLTAAVNALEKKVASENQANVTLSQLESEVTAARTVYQDYLGRFAQTSTEAELQEPEADLITHADVPLGITGPPRTQLIAIALIFGLGMGTGAALLIERGRKGIRRISDLDDIPGLFALGMVPLFSGNLRRQYLTQSGAARFAPRVTPALGGTDVSAYADGTIRSSAYVETVEAIRTILCFGQSRFRAKVIVVTSAVPDEGKTTLALSLAANTGRVGKRALVIDCDMRGPSVLQALEIPRRPAGSATSGFPGDGTLERDVLPGVDVMSLMPGPGAEEHILQPGRLGVIVSELSPHYDMIILDTPPVLAFPDAAVLSHQTDGVVLAVRWGKTSHAAVASAMRQMRAYDVRVLGSVLTQAPLTGPDRVEDHQTGVYSHYRLLAS